MSALAGAAVGVGVLVLLGALYVAWALYQQLKKMP